LTFSASDLAAFFAWLDEGHDPAVGGYLHIL